jgi:ABC-2 type transport system permease protein
MGVYEEEYATYDGPLQETGAWWTIATQTIRTLVGFLRTKLVVFLLWIPPVVAAVALIAQYALRSRSGVSAVPDGGAIPMFVQFQVYSLALLYMASGAGVVSHDLKHRTLQLYFSKPIDKWEYGFGKYLALLGLGAVVTILPACVVGGLRIALLGSGEVLGPVVTQVGFGLLVSALATAVLAAVVVGLSSLTPRTGYVVLAWIGLLLVPMIVRAILSLSTVNPDAAELVSLPGNVRLASTALVTEQSLQIPEWSPFVVLALFAGLGIGALTWRLRQLEGIA